MMITPRWMEEARQGSARRRRLLVSLVGAAIAEAPAERAECIFRRRLDWNVHKQTLLLEGQFKRCYRMDVASFEQLLLMIRPALQRDEFQSTRRTGTDPVTPDDMLQMTIWWLAGSNYHTTRGLAGTYVSGIYGYMHAVMSAICDCPELCIRSPTESEERMLELADDFTNISKDGIMIGCVGCIDGWLCHIRAPSSREVPDVAAFFSGHYQMYGVNAQAIVARFDASRGIASILRGK